MATRILVMGIPGSGKSLRHVLTTIGRTVDWYNADKIRTEYNDWDFSTEGRIRQSRRMQQLSINSTADVVICDFVAPLPEQRKIFNADYTIWVHTGDESNYPETDAIFIPPIKYNFYVNTKNSEYWASQIVLHLFKLEQHPNKTLSL